MERTTKNKNKKSRPIICMYSALVVSPIRVYHYAGTRMPFSLQFVAFENKMVQLKRRIILSTTNKIQRYTVFSIIVDAVHVWGGFSADHQDLKNCTHSIWYVLGLLLLPLV
jgi:hypothetical protein